MTDGAAEAGSRPVDRLTFFSDAVVAIAITLLAIDLPVPGGSNAGQFWASVLHNGGHYGAFLISFLAIAAAWSQHHDIFRYVTRMDARLRTLNMVWLLAIILTPFATKLLTSHRHEPLTVHALRFGFYALLQALESAIVIAILRHVVSRELAPNFPEKSASDTVLRSASLVIGFAVSIPLFFATSRAWVLWLVTPFLVDRLYLLRRRRKLAREADAA